MDDENREISPPSVVEGCVTGSLSVVAQVPANGLTDLQMRFAQAFVENGGKSGPAALAAGYSHDTYGVRLLAKRKVQEEIARRVKMQSGSALAMAIGRLLKIVETSTDDKAAVQAALGLMDRFGMAAPKGPAVAVQVNNMTGGAAQAILSELEARRTARLAAQPTTIITLSGD